MDAWNGWPFARLYLLFVAVAFLVVGSQVFLFHWGAAFRSKAMYGPVVMAPIIAAAGVAAAIARNNIIGWTATVIFAVGFLDGLIGLVLHLRGVAARIGGFTIRNIVAGPPFLLPLAFAALAATGALAIVWQAW
jgi:hypothetical protein